LSLYPEDLKNLITNGARLEEIEKQAIKDGKISLAQDGVYKIFKGDCDFNKLKATFKVS
jgi:type II secretory ATPase GspE/PulE/Tfp pilus assembly ATPase PilB-like protein